MNVSSSVLVTSFSTKTLNGCFFVRLVSYFEYLQGLGVVLELEIGQQNCLGMMWKLQFHDSNSPRDFPGVRILWMSFGHLISLRDLTALPGRDTFLKR